MTLTEKSLNRFLTGAVVLQIMTYQPGGLHILFEGRTMLTVNANDNTLDIALHGPPVAESPNVGQQAEVGP